MNILSLFTPKPAGTFAGKVVAFTGTLQVGNRKMQRSEAQQIVKSIGIRQLSRIYGRLNDKVFFKNLPG